MNNLTIKRVFIAVTSVMVFLLVAIPSYAFDLDAAVLVYEEAQQNPQQYQEVYQQAPQQHTREYYQKKWLEQNQKQEPQVVMAQQHERNTQPAPEADDLFVAAVNGNNGQIGRLLAQGLDVNTANSERETSLHMAAAKGHYSTVIYLINNGAFVNARTVKNWIPLHHAVRFRHPNIVNYLIKRGSPASARTSDGLSAIDMAKNVNDYRLLSILGAR